MRDHPLEDLLDRLERERREADRSYNAALTAVDGAIQRSPRLPEAPPPFDTQTLPAINETWSILPRGAPVVDRSVKGRLKAFIWRLVGPPLEGQQAFNAALVDHLNRNAAAMERWPQTMTELVAEVRTGFAELIRFESLLVQYLQTITLYVDSKDRSLTGPEWRERLALMEQRVLALKRQVDDGVAGASASVSGQATDPAGDRPSGPAGAEVFQGAVNSITYVGFEDRFRGAESDIRSRVAQYLPLLESASDVVDVGCGRGELLAMLSERAVRARGVDPNAAMVEICRARGLDVELGDAVSFLERQPDASLGGLVAIQVVEHFEPAYLLRFLEMAFHKLRSGSPLILETLNPACWMAFFECYLRDLTHRQALHPDTLRYVVQAAGFTSVDVQFLHPVRDDDRLEQVPVPPMPELAALAEAINAHARKLNARLFAAMDYAVVARR